MNKTVVLGMSGGVDSSVSAIILMKEGYNVIGVTMKLWDSDKTAEEDAKEVCRKLGIEHHVVDFSQEFKRYVIEDFKNKYINAKTPNPCVECNRFLKFGALFDKAMELGADFIATGHYCKIEFSTKYNQYVLEKSDELNKDQSYFLYNIRKEVLPHIIFPLEKFKSKDEIRKIAKDYGLVVADKKDSQEICFIPNDNYIDFLNSSLSKEEKSIAMKQGCILDCNGCKRGKHNGIINYTVGQRKGLGIQNEKPLYVKNISVEKNEIVVGEKEEIYYKTIFASELNWLVDIDFSKTLEVQAKIRYLAKPANAIITFIDGLAKIDFEEAQMAPTPGQSIVFYDGQIVIGGGKIV
ncbi:MAG: tRNA 2-thiouridine(34) synthase MnmA [Clostridia bacterium]|nr:tRNA 2-thiouridine(34) synthase MnmA [Clostridia bacterium]